MSFERVLYVMSRKHCSPVKLLLTIAWIAGLFAGKCAANVNTDEINDFMLSVIIAENSLLCELITSSLLMYLAYFVLSTKPFLISLVTFANAWGIGFLGAACSVTFKSAAWLIRMFFLFPSYACDVVLLLFCYLGFGRNKVELRSLFVKSILLTSAIAVIDHFFISRYLISLF